MEQHTFPNDPTIAIIGLGYVGLPLALAFAKKYKIIGFDVNKKRVEELQKCTDATKCFLEGEIKSVQKNFMCTADETVLKSADIFIITVPTPVSENNFPDLKFVESAAAVVGRQLKKNSIVVLESTVYPGVTEEICLPILEKTSELSFANNELFLGYSPERINVGDKEHTLEKTIKVVAGSNKVVTDYLAKIYGSIISAGIYKAESIKVAEAAKVAENIQRDINIALMNELSLIFKRLNIDTQAVLNAAGTKWNFHKYTPGLVGGHCIGVDPSYLVYKAKQAGYTPKLIAAAREINDAMAMQVAEDVIHMLETKSNNSSLQQCNVLIMGLTFKENVTDVRNSKVKDIIKRLKEEGIAVTGCDPYLVEGKVNDEIQVENVHLEHLNQRAKMSHELFDAVIIVNKHQQFTTLPFTDLLALLKEKPLIYDLKGLYKAIQKPSYVEYRTL